VPACADNVLDQPGAKSVASYLLCGCGHTWAPRPATHPRATGPRPRARARRATHLVFELHERLLDAPQLLQVDGVDVARQLLQQLAHTPRDRQHLRIQAACVAPVMMCGRV
jgi:hypothetical protein